MLFFILNNFSTSNFFLRIFPSLSLWKVSWQFEHDKSSHFYSKTSIFIQEIHLNIKLLEMEAMKTVGLNHWYFMWKENIIADRSTIVNDSKTLQNIPESFGKYQNRLIQSIIQRKHFIKFSFYRLAVTWSIYHAEETLSL